MKYIVKKGAPRPYIDWCKLVKGKENEDYRRLQNPQKSSLQETLIKEQGGLCGYTMKRIDKETAHIEHIKPESLCRQEKKGSDLDYNNMLACFPLDGMSKRYRYGAQLKNKWWEDGGKLFVSPLRPECESLISFNLRGEVLASKNNPQAIKTIEVLGLDHSSLTEDRKRAIEEFIYGPTHAEPLSKKQAENAIDAIVELDFYGNFREYCVAIEYALYEYISFLEKVAAQKKYSAQQQKRKRK